MKNRHKELERDKYSRLSELGSQYNLAFSSHLVLGNRVIALDGINRKLLVSDFEKASPHSFVIDLDQTKAISIQKTYGSIKPGELRKRNFDDFVQSICLLFEPAENNKIISLSFFERERDKPSDLPMLERNARNWQMILSKMASSNTDKDIKIPNSKLLRA